MIQLRLVVLLISYLILTGCQTESVKELKPTTIALEYPGDIAKVTKIDLIDGSTGQRASIDDMKEIQYWLKLIKGKSLVPYENQEGRVGYRYRIIFYEDDVKKMDFTPHHINKVYYQYNEQLNQVLEELYAEKFDNKRNGD